MKVEEAINSINRELYKATDQHPYWPKDLIHQVSIMTEESGESIRAALNYVYEGGDFDEIRKELIQTGAMVLRCLINLDESKHKRIL